MKYIVICLSRCENECNNFRVDYNGKDTFETDEEARAALEADIEEYAEAERNAGREVEIAGNHLEWADDDGEREAKWYVYGIWG